MIGEMSIVIGFVEGTVRGLNPLPWSHATIGIAVRCFRMVQGLGETIYQISRGFAERFACIHKQAFLETVERFSGDRSRHTGRRYILEQSAEKLRISGSLRR